MMATVLVALMAFAVQSCGSDDKDDLSSSPYEIVGAFNVQQKGELTDTDIATLKEKFAQLCLLSPLRPPILRPRSRSASGTSNGIRALFLARNIKR